MYFSTDIREHVTTFQYTEMIPNLLELLQIHSCSTPKKINKDNVKMYLTQLPGRIFSPSDISKKLSHRFLLHFPIGMGSYDHHTKYQGVFMDLL